MTLYGEGGVHGEVSVETGIDSDGNKYAGADVRIENEEGSLSAEASGQVSQDSEGNTHAEAKIRGTFSF